MSILWGTVHTTTVSESVIRDNTTYGAWNSLTATSTFIAENNFWNATSGPYHATLNPDGDGDAITSYVDFDPWLGQLNYTHVYDSVDDANEEILWKWVASSTQTYADEWDAGVATWNALDPITITETAGTPDLEVEEVDLPAEIWSGVYDPFSFTPPRVRLNLDKITASIPVASIQETWTHELGHALGLDHSYWENVMYYRRTIFTSLGAQDIEDYHYLWGY